MRVETIQFRKLIYMIIQEHFGDINGTFFNGLEAYIPDDMAKEEAILDIVETQQLITGLYLRRMASEYSHDDIELEGRIALARLGEALLSDIEKIN